MDTAAWEMLYRLWARSGIHKPVVPCPHPTGGPDALLGWPGVQHAIVDARHDPAGWRKAGWTVTVLDRDTARALPAALSWLEDVSHDHRLATAETSATAATSSHERRLLDLLLRSDLPPPDRNLRFSAGKVETVPDFAWADVRLAVFVDGAWWHGGRELSKLVADAASGKRGRKLVDQHRTGTSRDAAKRRAMTAAGWTTLVVTDAELDEDGGVEAAAAEIVAAYRTCRSRLPPVDAKVL